jgi:hypothetical protein
MLPFYIEMSERQYKASIEQLNNLNQVMSKPHILNKDTVERIIRIHTSQNDDSWVFFEQCKKWRTEKPTQDELKLIAGIEKNAAKLEEVNNEIIALANSLKDITIEAILDKDDIEFGLEYLLQATKII